jgi:dihydrolipoamide dehydrogenase
MAEQDFDVLIIGAGPGGYVCAIRAAQLGFRAACVEKEATLGGTCLNVGCIPSKALLKSSELFAHARSGLAQHGIKAGRVELDLAQMLARKDKVVSVNTAGVAFLFKKNKIAWIRGTARLLGANKVEIANGGATDTVSARAIVIATGSETMPLANIAVDEKRIVSSTGALVLGQVPKRLAVIGAGYIGLELGTVWRRLGAEVTVIEVLDRILPGMDGEVSRAMQRILAKQGLQFLLQTKVTGAKAAKNGVALSLAAMGGENREIEAETVLVAIGRRPFTEGLGLAEAGVEIDNRGRIKVDQRYQTTAPGIYAIGDVIEGPMLAHKAEDEGVALAEILAGQSPHLNYDAIPGVVYTWPEVAQVGKTEEELQAAGIAYRAGKYPFSANPRARSNADAEGFVKILADAGTDKVLGCHIIGPEAGDLIHELALAIEFGASSEDIARTPHAHPTLNEAVREAALACANRALHI